MAGMQTPQVAPGIAEANAALRMRLPFANTEDFDDARRGRVGSLSDGVIRNTHGRVVWDADAYGFLDEECPETANPSLWRQSRLNVIHGLFEVTERIYQVRGLDLSNMTIVEGDEGILVIDPLISVECAAAASLPPDFVSSLTNEQLFDALAVQIDGPRASGRRITLHWTFSDTGDEYSVTLANGVLTHRNGVPADASDAVIRVERTALDEVIAGMASIEAVVNSGRLTVGGDQSKLGELLSLLDPPDPSFAIVTP